MLRNKVLYISYDGLLEPLGRSQVLAYARKLAKDFQITLLTFEKTRDLDDVDRVEMTRLEVEKFHIQWIPLRYHKRPTLLATGFDIAHGLLRALWLSRGHDFKIVHARSYVAAMIGLFVKSILRKRFVFDMRGFWVDEGITKGMWRENSVLYRLGRFFERQYLCRADAVVSLTNAAVSEMRQWTYLRSKKIDFRVIPTCCDLERFTIDGKKASRDDSFVLGCVGNVSIWYRFDSVLQCFKILRQSHPNAKLLVLNRDQQEFILKSVDAAEVPRSAVELVAVHHENVASQIRRMNAAVFFIRPSFAELARAPTKLGELLGCGVPCLTTRGIGDMDLQIGDGKVGVLVDFNDLDRPEILGGAILQLIEMAADPETKVRCNEAAQRYFSLDGGASRYRELYFDLLSEVR